MKKIIVCITETLQKKVEIEAENYQDAIDKVQEMYYNEDVILDSADYLTVEFDTKETILKKNEKN